MNKSPESTHQIRFPDCDPLNHLNNARYLDYFMNAREDHLQDNYDFSLFGYTQETGKTWVVSQNQIAYLLPAFLMEKVVIQSTILEWNEKDILVEMRMWNQKKDKLKSILWARYYYFDLKSQRSIPHEPQLAEDFKGLVNPLSSNMSFEDRVREIRMKKYQDI